MKKLNYFIQQFLPGFSTFISVHPYLAGLILAVLIEILSIVLRFGFKLRSPSTTGWVAQFTFGYRVHHGYVGALLVLIVFFLPENFLTDLMFVLGLGLLGSDLLHHFVVLWPLTGHHEFFLKY